MKITVLVDNNSIIDRYLLAEPGLSLLIEDDDTRILFDLGYSDTFLQNARKLNISMAHLDYLVFSHGHLDHTWGLDPFLKYLSELAIERISHQIPTLIAHPETFTSVSTDGFNEFGSLLSREKLAKHFKMHLSREPVKLNDRITFLGQIPRENSFESKTAFGRKEGERIDDFVVEDSALVYHSTKGLVILTGCSHSGICNITEYARQITGESVVLDIIGGLHLLNPSKEQLDGTLRYLKGLNLQSLHACHCTDLHSKIALSSVANLREVGVGLCFDYPE